MFNVIEEVAEGRAHVEWATVTSKHKDLELDIYVPRDAVKFDHIPALEWDFDPVREDDPWYVPDTFDSVRLPSSAWQLQHIADLMGSMLMTPKVIDLIWQQADLKFDPVINTPWTPTYSKKRRIVANSHIHVVHHCIEEKIARLGGDTGGLISCVGKYWCLVNRLAGSGLLYGSHTACNYGWLSSLGSLRAVTPGLRCYQNPGCKHDDSHWDPSQTIRVMYRQGVLRRSGDSHIVDLYDVAQDPELAPLISHEGVLHYLRQADVPAPTSSIALEMYAPSIAA